MPIMSVLTKGVIHNVALSAPHGLLRNFCFLYIYVHWEECTCTQHQKYETAAISKCYFY